MLRTVLIGLGVLVLGVFAYVGYNSYAFGRRPTGDDVYTGTNINPGVESKPAAGAGSSLPQTAVTGTDPGAASEVTAQGASDASGVTAPASDSVAANPPNGMTFGGSGHYQLYRQGDLTWRLNTDTGETCVIFATDEEWHKPKVYKAGCRGK